MKFIRWETRHCADPTDRRAYKGGGSSSTTSDSPTTNTTNTDRRAAIQGGAQFTEGSSGNSVYVQAADAHVLETLADSLPDAVRFMAASGADVINNVGGAVVDLNRDSLKANSASFDHVLEFGANAVDKLIDASTKTNAAGVALAGAALQNYAPDPAKDAQIQKWAIVAAAGVVAIVMLGKK